MRISAIKATRIENIILPDKVEGSYWISGTDSNGIKRNLLSIEASEGRWKLISNKEVYYVANEIMQPSVFLDEGKFYKIKNDIEKNTFLLYCSCVQAKYQSYSIEDRLDKGFGIGKKKNFITYDIVDDLVCTIKRVDGKIFLTDNNSKCGVYVNDVRVRKTRELKIGDIIFIAGLKIILSALTNPKKSYSILVNTEDIITARVDAMPTGKIEPINAAFEEPVEEIELPMYDENEYFHKVPRFFQKSETLELNIDPPPSREESRENPLLLTMGPMITMSMTSIVTGYIALNNVLSGNTTFKTAAPSIVMSAAMLASVFIWPLFTRWYQQIQRVKNEKERQKKYTAYIQSKREEIVNAKLKQSAILKNNYMGTMEAVETIENHYTSLWQRRISDEDFLEVSLGRGAAQMKIDIKYPEEHFSMVEDNLKDIVDTLGKEPKLLNDVPIILSLKENFISGFIGNDDMAEYLRRLLLQVIALHSYDDLKIVVLTDDEKEYRWKFLKDVPHTFTDNKTMRYFGTNTDEYKEICYKLEKVFEERKEISKSNETKIEDYDKIYLIVTDSLKKVRSFDIIDNILKSNNYYGFSILVLDKKMTNLPDQCGTFISLNGELGELKNSKNINESITFQVDLDAYIDFDSCIKAVANIPIEISLKDESQLTNRLDFLEMYDVGKIEQLNASVRWKQNNPILTLQAPVGVGKNGEKITIDLHEKYHGPHGLIAGMTGSGKSEFIITYILSMALNYHPYEVQFILIDYKGGGLAGAFENKTTGLKLPHLVGTITNLDANEIKRSLASIDSELKRRQTLFNKAREIAGESTIDIYKYQSLYREGIITEPVSHLFIISDEFAELKNQEPEFMDQLISAARIGRSLGVHLILATQKPSGVVDPQIWSNTRFRVCMRVQDKSDSNEIIKCPDAAFLKQTGRFYFQVGYNEVFLLGQAAYAGGKYIPKEKGTKSLDTSIDFIDNLGNVFKKVDTKVKKEVQEAVSLGEELQNIVVYLDKLANEQGIKCRPLWLEKIPADIRIENLKVKYAYQKEEYKINPIIGEYDIPTRQEQKILTIPFTDEGNVLVYGASGSGKENLITTLVYSSMLTYTPEDINYYIVDFGSESLKAFNGYPIVGDILTPEDDEKIKNLYKMIESMIEERKALFSSYNGDYYTYCKNSGNKIPAIIVALNNYESYQESYSEFDDRLVILTRECTRYGIYFIITVNTPNGMRFKLKQNFSSTLVLEQNSDDDYTTILGNVYKNYPARIFGRGIFKTDEVYEFQTALVADKSDINRFIKSKVQEFQNLYPSRAKSIPVLPEVVSYNEIASEVGKTNELVIGINKYDLSITKFDFDKTYTTIVTSVDLSSLVDFVNPLINQLIIDKTSNLIVINAEDFYIDPKYTTNYQYVEDKFDNIFNSLITFLDKQRTQYVEAGYDKSIFKNKKKIFCIIIGVDNFKNRLSADFKMKFGDLFNFGKDLGIIDFILVDSIDKIKKIETEMWYKNAVNNNYGIWIGNNINDQFSLKFTQKLDEMKTDIPSNFCFVIKRGKVEYVKFVESFELQIENNQQ